MEQILAFFDQLALDETLFWRIPLTSEDGSLELSWRRGGKPSSWNVRLPGHEEWRAYDAPHLKVALQDLGVDLSACKRQLGASIMTQAVFADMVLEGAMRIFGQEAVERSIHDTRVFLAQISEIAAQVSASPPPPEILAPPAGRAHKPPLRLVTKL